MNQSKNSVKEVEKEVEKKKKIQENNKCIVGTSEAPSNVLEVLLGVHQSTDLGEGKEKRVSLTSFALGAGRGFGLEIGHHSEGLSAEPFVD